MNFVSSSFFQFGGMKIFNVHTYDSLDFFNVFYDEPIFIPNFIYIFTFLIIFDNFPNHLSIVFWFFASLILCSTFVVALVSILLILVPWLVIYCHLLFLDVILLSVLEFKWAVKLLILRFLQFLNVSTWCYEFASWKSFT